jgi:deoxyhypusine synthase
MESLELLDLAKCGTVAELVEGMRKCSFGARMLGEAVATIASWIKEGAPPFVVYDRKIQKNVSIILESMRSRGFVKRIMTSEEYVYSHSIDGDTPVLVVDFISGLETALYEKSSRSISINQFGQAKPGKVRDGFFPDVVFSDPAFVLPVIYSALMEIIEGRKTSVIDFVESLEDKDGLAGEVYQGATTLQAMVNDPDCTVFLTLSGAMTIAKMGLLICDLIDHEMVQYISSTGALMAHGLIEGIGLKHYKYDPRYSDSILADQSINRVTDTLEPEENFDHIEKIVEEVLSDWGGGDPKLISSPSDFHRAIGEYLHKHYPNDRAILKSAFERNVPVCVPAFADSEIGNDLYVENERRGREIRPSIIMNLERDTALLLDMAKNSRRMGIFSIGGGVPRNNTQNVAPLIEIMNNRLGVGLPERRFFYGCRIDPTPLWYGNLSGCTYSEGGSWRKMDFNGQFAEVHADATIVWPFIQKFAMNR